MYTLLDLHQDVLWRAEGNGMTSGYWGVPPWIKDKLIDTAHQFPWPFNGLKRWECGYLTEHISMAFQRFYSNENHVADDFAAFWEEMAKRYKDDNAIIGYELMNEPFVGDIFRNHLLILPGNAGRDNLEPLYHKTQEAIRKHDQEKLIFWEPVS